MVCPFKIEDSLGIGDELPKEVLSESHWQWLNFWQWDTIRSCEVKKNEAYSLLLQKKKGYTSYTHASTLYDGNKKQVWGRELIYLKIWSPMHGDTDIIVVISCGTFVCVDFRLRLNSRFHSFQSLQ